MKLNTLRLAFAGFGLSLTAACSQPIVVAVVEEPVEPVEEVEEVPAEPAEPAEPEESPWISLFDGETTTGWTNYGKDTISDGWQVIDGELTMVGGGGDIVTKDMYGNFELEIEWKIAEAGNSGIFYGVLDGGGAVWHSGPEMQVLDNAKHPNGTNVLTSAGACYGLYPTTKDAVNGPGEWNKAGIRYEDGAVTHLMNDEVICEYVIGSDDWNKRVANTKFKEMPLFGTAKRGRIALQDHSDRVAYRAIRIRNL